MADITIATNCHYIQCPPYDRNQDKFPLSPNLNPPRCNRCIENAMQRLTIMIDNGFMNQKNLQGEISFTRVALIRAAIGYCEIFINTLSQIANWSPKAKELIIRGKEIINTIIEGLDHKGDGERGGSLMPPVSPYELVIKIMIEEQIDRNLGPRVQLSEFTFNS